MWQVKGLFQIVHHTRDGQQQFPTFAKGGEGGFEQKNTPFVLSLSKDKD
jgi:hypothetical protein